MNTSKYSHDVEQAIEVLVSALSESKGWMRAYADSIIRDAIDRVVLIRGPQITHVAIIGVGKIYSLPAPGRHHDIIRYMSSAHGFADLGENTQGFLDENGKFLDRFEAYDLACKTGQINRRPGGYDGPQLFSEDLW